MPDLWVCGGPFVDKKTAEVSSGMHIAWADSPRSTDQEEVPVPKQVTAKFRVANRKPGYNDECTIVECFPDYADERNKEWAWATPAGSISLTIRNTTPAADFFELGKSLLVTFTDDEVPATD